MKKNTKCITLIITVLLMLLLIGCGNSGSSGSNTTANTSGGTSEDSDTDSIASDSEDADMEEEGEDSDADQEEIWNMFNAAAINGQTVSYGPITITLPEGYTVEDKSSSRPIFRAMDSSDAEVTPYIAFQMSPMVEYSSDAEANKEGFIAGMEGNLSEDFEFKELVSYDETEVGEYKAMKFLAKVDCAGTPLVVESYMIFEKTDGMGKCVTILYAGSESDTERLSAFEASLDAISERSDTSNIESGVIDKVSEWQRIFNSKSEANGSPLAINGNSVTYGPLQMELPDGFTIEDETAESPTFYDADRTYSFTLSFGEESYQELSDRAYMETVLKEEYESIGPTYASGLKHEAISIDGYDAYRAGIEYTAIDDGEKVQQLIFMIFETTDGTTAPMIMVKCTADAETAKNILEEVGEAFSSIRLVSE